ncbi:MAG: hypothetical protein ACRDMV_24215 [Streptosporangiales bacterium]
MRWLHRWAVVAGWVAGMGWGTYMLIQEGFASSVHVLPFLPQATGAIYIAFSAFIANLVVCFIGTGIARLLGARPQPLLLPRQEYLEPKR